MPGASTRSEISGGGTAGADSTVDAYEDPGTPRTRGGWWYLWWAVARQGARPWAAGGPGTVWMVLPAAQPYMMQRAVDQGLLPGHTGVLAGVERGDVPGGGADRLAEQSAAPDDDPAAHGREFPHEQAGRGAGGAAGGRAVAAGRGRGVVTVGVGDVNAASDSLSMVGPGVASIVSYGVVAGPLVAVSAPLALVVLLVLPALAVVTGPLGRRLQGVESEYRERRSVLTARVVPADPHTLVPDEATALLDPTTARHTERALAAVLRGRAVIAVAHRLRTAGDADRVTVMEHGRPAGPGTHDELVAAGGAYAALWRTWHGDAGRP